MQKFFYTKGLIRGIKVLLIAFTLFRSEPLRAQTLDRFYKSNNPDLGQAQAFGQKPWNSSEWSTGVTYQNLQNEIRNNLLSYPICDSNGTVPQWTEDNIIWAGTDPLKSMTIYPKGSTMNAMWNPSTGQAEYQQATLDGSVGIHVILCEYHFDANHQVVYDPKYYALFKKTAGTTANGHACINPQRAIFSAYVPVKTVVKTVPEPYPVPGETVYLPGDTVFTEVPVDKPYPVYQESGNNYGYAEASVGFSAGVSYGYAPTMPQQQCCGGNYYYDNSYTDNSYYNNEVTNVTHNHTHHHEDPPPVDHPSNGGPVEANTGSPAGPKGGDHNGETAWDDGNGNNDGSTPTEGGRNGASSNGLLASNAIRNNTTTPKVDVKSETRKEVDPRGPKTFSASPRSTVNPQALADTRSNNLTQGETQIRNFDGGTRKETVGRSNLNGPHMNANQTQGRQTTSNSDTKGPRTNNNAPQKRSEQYQPKNQNHDRGSQSGKPNVSREQRAPQKQMQQNQQRPPQQQHQPANGSRPVMAANNGARGARR